MAGRESAAGPGEPQPAAIGKPKLGRRPASWKALWSQPGSGRSDAAVAVPFGDASEIVGGPHPKVVARLQYPAARPTFPHPRRTVRMRAAQGRVGGFHCRRSPISSASRFGCFIMTTVHRTFTFAIRAIAPRSQLQTGPSLKDGCRRPLHELCGNGRSYVARRSCATGKQQGTTPHSSE